MSKRERKRVKTMNNVFRLMYLDLLLSVIKSVTVINTSLYNFFCSR